MALPLDIMSIEPGLVGAETFAAVHPPERQIGGGLAKLSMRPEASRYVFFMSPSHPGAQQWPTLELGCIQVWSVDL